MIFTDLIKQGKESFSKVISSEDGPAAIMLGAYAGMCLMEPKIGIKALASTMLAISAMEIIAPWFVKELGNAESIGTKTESKS